MTVRPQGRVMAFPEYKQSEVTIVVADEMLAELRIGLAGIFRLDDSGELLFSTINVFREAP